MIKKIIRVVLPVIPIVVLFWAMIDSGFIQFGRGSHYGVDDEYSRGFYNAMSIIQHRYNLHSYEKDSLPYWPETVKSGKDGIDLYNYWDTTYMHNIKNQP